jgi:hypothetical protein
VDKKLGQITVHLPPEEEAIFRRLAEADGMSGSELGHQLFSRFIEKKRSYLEHLSQAFGAPENQQNK